jgi:hypothetical protein
MNVPDPNSSKSENLEIRIFNGWYTLKQDLFAIFHYFQSEKIGKDLFLYFEVEGVESSLTLGIFKHLTIYIDKRFRIKYWCHVIHSQCPPGKMLDRVNSIIQSGAVKLGDSICVVDLKIAGTSLHRMVKFMADDEKLMDAHKDDFRRNAAALFVDGIFDGEKLIKFFD